MTVRADRRFSAALFLGGALACAGASVLALEYVPAISSAPVPGLSELRAGPLSPPLARRVVVLVLDGARRDRLLAAMRARPSAANLLARGALFDGKSGHPTLSRPMYATLGSGTTPEITGVASNSHSGVLRVDSVIVQARRAGLEVILRDDATTWWWDLFQSPPEERAPSMEVALERLRGAGRALAFLHHLEIDAVAHDHGTLGPEYAAALARGVDRIHEVAAALDLSRDFLVVTADHGHRDRGGHGGQEPEVTAVPLWIFGSPVRPGTYARARLRDVAPTVAVAAGLPYPAQSQGRPLLEALDLAPAAALAAADRWLSQRWRLTNAVLAGLDRQPKLPPTFPRGEHAFNAARLMARDFAAAEKAAFEGRARQGRWIRTAMVAPLLLGIIFVLVRRRPRPEVLGWALLAAGLYYSVYGAIFPFSISAIRDKIEFYLCSGILAVVSQNLVAWILVWRARRAGDARLLADAGIANALLALAEIGAMFVWTGLGSGAALPSPTGYLVPALAMARAAVVFSLWGCIIAPLSRKLVR